MICPLYSRANVDGRDFTTKIQCHKKECAWWDVTKELCRIQVIDYAEIGGNLKEVAKQLARIAEGLRK